MCIHDHHDLHYVPTYYCLLCHIISSFSKYHVPHIEPNINENMRFTQNYHPYRASWVCVNEELKIYTAALILTKIASEEKRNRLSLPE